MERETERLRRSEVCNLVETIVKWSTVVPFRWHECKYMCFYCDYHSFESSKLREHFDKHPNADITGVLLRIMYTNYRIKLDIVQMICTLCDEEFETFGDYIHHVAEAHHLVFAKGVVDQFELFKLDDTEMECLECGSRFEYFSNLLSHTHKMHVDVARTHKYLCEVCGKGHSSKSALLIHAKQTHEIQKCRFCEEIFTSRYTLYNHIGLRHDMEKLKCPMCPKVLPNRYLRKRHLALDHDCKTMQLFCDICNRLFTRRSKLDMHKKIMHSKEKRYTCEVCGVRFRRLEALKKHIESHNVYPSECEGSPKVPAPVRASPDISHRPRKEDLIKILRIILENSTIMPFRWSSNNFMCFFCGCPFVNSSTLKQHTKSEHENPKLKNVLTFYNIARVKLDISEISCKHCPKDVASLNEFLNHAASEHNLHFNRALSQDFFSFKLTDSDLHCLDCGEEFKFFGSLLVHAHKYHNRSSTFLCEICGLGFVAKSNVTNHIRHMHKKSECEICNKLFSSQYAMTAHLEKVHKQDKLKCPQCPEILGSRYLKKRHLALVHNEQSKQYKCEECAKIFTVRSKLLEHLGRIHLKEKRMACEICGFKVFNKAYLKKHMVRHDDSRPFQCDICKKSFQRRKTLEQHRRIHTNDRRYACKECGKAFVQVTSLKLHLKVHHSSNDPPAWS